MTEDLESKAVDTRGIWLTVFGGGGKWTVNEIAMELGGSSDLVCRFINQMSARGYLRRHKTEGKRLEYSVDRTCKIPLGLDVGDLMDSGAI